MSSISAGTTSTTTLVHSGDTTGSLVFKTNDTGSGGTTAVTIDTSQNVGIGTSSPLRKFHVKGSGNTSQFESTSSSGYVYIGDSASSAIDNQGIGTVGNNLSFLAGGSERMRIDSSGNLLVGVTTGTNGRIKAKQTISDNVLYLDGSNASPYGLQVYYSTAAPNGTGAEFIYCNDTSATRFVARSNGGLANYSANNVNLSDRREKTNFSPSKSYLDVICAIPVQTFNYIDQNMEEDAGLTLGVVAQDVQAVAPELVMESNWASRGEPEKMRLSIYQTDLQYALMKSIQELKAINDTQAETINALTARVVALEGQ